MSEGVSSLALNRRLWAGRRRRRKMRETSVWRMVGGSLRRHGRRVWEGWVRRHGRRHRVGRWMRRMEDG